MLSLGRFHRGFHQGSLVSYGDMQHMWHLSRSAQPMRTTPAMPAITYTPTLGTASSNYMHIYASRPDGGQGRQVVVKNGHDRELQEPSTSMHPLHRGAAVTNEDRALRLWVQVKAIEPESNSQKGGGGHGGGKGRSAPAGWRQDWIGHPFCCMPPTLYVGARLLTQGMRGGWMHKGTPCTPA